MNARTLPLGLLPVLLTLLLVAHVGVALAGAPGTAKYDFRVTDMPLAGLRQPALDRDNTMYVGGADGNVYKINPDGTIGWIFNAGSPVVTNAAIYYNPEGPNAPYSGKIYVGLNNGDVLAIDVSGNPEWRFDTGGTICTSPALAADGTIYVGVEGKDLVAINPDGSPKWVFDGPVGHVIHDPVVAPNGTIYYGTRWMDADVFYAVNPDGSEKWRRGVTGGVYTPAAIGADGTLYFGGREKLWALWPNGDTRWVIPLDEGALMEGAPAIGHEGTIYVSASALIAINPDGSVEWVFSTGLGPPPCITYPAAVDSNGLIYAPAWDGHIYCVAPNGTQSWRYFAAIPDTWLSACVIGSDGLAYSTGLNYVRALYTGATGPFDSSWPMYRHDAQCTARLDKFWSMRDALGDLLFSVAEADLGDRIKRQLVLRLRLAMRSLDAGLLLPAVHQLGAFVHYVGAQAGKKIPEELADVLTREALDIMALADGYWPPHKPCWRGWGWGCKHRRFAPCWRRWPRWLGRFRWRGCSN